MTEPTRNIDAEIQSYKDSIALRDALVRLEKNPDFKKVMLDHYGDEFAKQLVMQRADPSFRARPEVMEANTRKIDAVSEFFGYIRTLHAIGANAEANLTVSEQTRDAILEEQE